MVGVPYTYNELTQGFVYTALRLYEEMIQDGVAPELARMVLPQNMFTSWIWTGSLYAFARIANLRLDSHAQKETQDFAKKLSTIAEGLFPVSWAVLVTNKQ
jgi:thymidylate synthase (FAD)